MPERFLDKDAEIARKLQHPSGTTFPATQPHAEDCATERSGAFLDSAELDRLMPLRATERRDGFWEIAELDSLMPLRASHTMS
jgi:hypothetical protein